MNETLQVIHSRRSIRKYRPEPVSDTEIKAIIQAALYAPSARNQQAWHFTIVRDPAMMCNLKETQKANMLRSGIESIVQRASEPGYVAFHNAPMLIIISAEEKAGSVLIDCGAAAQNIALAAESLDIGTCLMTSSERLFANDTEGVLKKTLGIPEGYRHVLAISVGYKDCEQPKPASRRENLVNYL
jgi:nitroreductase